MRCKACGSPRVREGFRFDYCCGMKIYWCGCSPNWLAESGGYNFAGFQAFLIKFARLHKVTCPNDDGAIRIP